MGYRSTEVASGSCGAAGFLLFRSVGTTSRAPSGANRNLAQRAKAGYFSCYAEAMRAATPPVFAPGGYSAVKAKCLAL